MDLINDYFKERNNLMCFNSYSNDVRLFRNHIVKTFISRERMEKCIIGLQIMSNSPINVPRVQFVCAERNVIVENFINGISLNEYTTHLTERILYDIGKIMGCFHNVNVSSSDDEKKWVVTILSDIMDIRQKLIPYGKDFDSSINFVENESKNLFYNLHFTYVHGDFRPDNIIFCQENNKYYIEYAFERFKKHGFVFHAANSKSVNNKMKNGLSDNMTNLEQQNELLYIEKIYRKYAEDNQYSPLGHVATDILEQKTGWFFDGFPIHSMGYANSPQLFAYFCGKSYVYFDNIPEERRYGYANKDYKTARDAIVWLIKDRKMEVEDVKLE